MREKAGLGFTFTNTGSIPWTFYATASLRKPDGSQVHLPLRPVPLEPGESGDAYWTYVIDEAGPWDLMFGLWREYAQYVPLGTTGWLSGYIVGQPLE